jgi:hypothetical protein
MSGIFEPTIVKVTQYHVVVQNGPDGNPLIVTNSHDAFKLVSETPTGDDLVLKIKGETNETRDMSGWNVVLITDEGKEMDRKPVNTSVKIRGIFLDEMDTATGKRKSMEMKTDSLSGEELSGKVKSVCKVEEKPKDEDIDEDIKAEKEEEI